MKKDKRIEDAWEDSCNNIAITLSDFKVWLDEYLKLNYIKR